MSSLNSLPVLKPKKVEPTQILPKSDKELERLRKIRERIIRNRASANASRQKKKEYVALLEKKNKELTQHTEKINKENQKLKNENENLKLQIQFLNQTLNKMNALINENDYNKNNNNNNNNVQVPNMLDFTTNNGIYSSPITENNFTSDINSINQLNSPESLSNSSPLLGDIQSIPYIPSTNTDLSNIINSNVNTYIDDMNALPLQSTDTLLPENNATNIGDDNINEILDQLFDGNFEPNPNFLISTAEQQQQLQELISEKKLYSTCSNFSPKSNFEFQTTGNELSQEQLLQILEQQVYLLERQNELTVI